MTLSTAGQLEWQGMCPTVKKGLSGTWPLPRWRVAVGSVRGRLRGVRTRRDGHARRDACTGRWLFGVWRFGFLCWFRLVFCVHVSVARELPAVGATRGHRLACDNIWRVK